LALRATAAFQDRFEPASQIAVPRALAAAPFSRIGDRIIVPPESPFVRGSSSRNRSQGSAPYAGSAGRCGSRIPPNGEVMTPVAGRVIDLKVQLGGRVVQGQELAIIDFRRSGANLCRHRESAHPPWTLTKKGPGPADGAGKNGRNRDQGPRTGAERLRAGERPNWRAESRLRAIGISPDQKPQSRLLSLKAPGSGSLIDLQVAPGAFLNDPTAATMTHREPGYDLGERERSGEGHRVVSPDRTRSGRVSGYDSTVRRHQRRGSSRKPRTSRTDD